jgi:signal transduction histidine kinase
MRLKWKLRLYYAALLLGLLGVLATATTAIVLRDFRMEIARRDAAVQRNVRRLLQEHTQEIRESLARALQDTEFLQLARRDLSADRKTTMPEWVPLAERLSQRYDLPLLKILDAEGFVLSSAHWRASYSLRDSPGLILSLEAENEDAVRLVRERGVDGEFLALLASQWVPQPRRYVLIGGVRADSLLESSLAERSGVGVRFALVDEPASIDTTAWVPLPASPSEFHGGVHLDFDPSAIRSLAERLAQIFAIAALGGMLLAWLLGLWISSRVTRPLEEVAAGAAVVATGRTPQLIQPQGSTEIRELVQSFNSMTQSLAESRERLRHAERIAAWREVARRIAHEIKNALVPIQLSIENVARSVHTGRGDLASLAEESVSTVRTEIDGLTRLVNSFSEVARLPDPDPTPNALHETWERAVNSMNEELAVYEVGLETVPTLRYDEDQIRRAFHNLALNAQEAGATRLDCRATRSSQGVRLEITDNGPGIPAEDLPHVFEPYFTRKEHGTGLGLAIVYKIINDHGWSVGVVSPARSNGAGNGTRFTIDIPLPSIPVEEGSHAS